ncbi:MAG: hypothetical protein D6722_02895 [Bacteroidetes bacterium]|nr:MAG: hypothetical protein D6722_02895 [Bacteroidota bacterium]
MATSPQKLSTSGQDYLLATWENDQLTMIPHCACGQTLDEDYTCRACGRQCACDFVLCRDMQTLQVVQRLICGNPQFKNLQADVLG